jgi:tartrate-resistant acid phosphatase type 5
MRHPLLAPGLALVAACGTATGTLAPAADETTLKAATTTTTGADTTTLAEGPSVKPPPAPPDVTRFVALGDTGEGNATQFQVSRAVENVCQARGGCDFALLLGDNIYPSGVDAVDDAQFDTKFERPYANLDFPFHPALGNHDYGGQGAGIEYWKGQYEVDYSLRSRKWRMPAAYYRLNEPFADLFALDTNGIHLGFADRDEQEQTLPVWLSEARAPWKIAYGHHPYLSNGKHGNAGRYEGLPEWLPGSGTNMRDFVETVLCGRVDVYLCGHDHNLQDLGEACGTQFLVSGAGAKTTPLEGDNPTAFEAETPGFVLVEARADTLDLTFFDGFGKALHARTLRK